MDVAPRPALASITPFCLKALRKRDEDMALETEAFKMAYAAYATAAPTSSATTRRLRRWGTVSIFYTGVGARG